jgi:hypothetical protein
MRLKKVNHKTAEKVRRDRLRKTIEDLLRILSQPCCNSPSVDSQIKTSPSAGKGISESQASCKASTIEFSIYYITCLKSQMDSLQRQLQIYKAEQRAEKNA